ncbi:ATP-binding protein [Kribbella shirazensis]|uniref:Putative ATPase/DNA-binding CsgD family transcriptional regulator n=1 Tax=Kribbella shirazensis TaxID=1105143 RepID=A0A7X6A5E3_9ACTN|nr:LuxR C-terminal-related transcriptional regulator [Kribbella shirazensis]NIK62436.1 putative ATPase/DNA-binding CsgD family transcriptional regulator [Kribbella shirazensis]
MNEVSAREAEVLAAVADHRSNAQIARALHISVRTVESHVSSLLRKYGVTDRRELADLAGAQRGPGVTGLPAGRTTFVGRSSETTAVRTALEQSRLVTLLGPGGMGKTRLAAVVAAEVGAAGAFVDLVPVRDGLVPRAVATALGVTERPPQSLEQVLFEHLQQGRSLLVLDNCEHLVDEVAVLVEQLLRACPEVTILATSRERLGVPAETTVLLPPLDAATELFTDRARAVDPSFTAPAADLAEICARLDGMPLAIELAAARIGSLGADGLKAALDDRLRLLAGGRGVDVRHRSLAAVIGWSHELLDDQERLLFRRLSIYVGGFDLDAACATSPELGRSEVADLLGRLTDKSLAVRRGSRWRLLETIREFAREQLTDDELAIARDRCLRWAADTAAVLESRLDSSGWQPPYDEVAGDLRAALASTAAAPDPAAHRLARSLGHLSFARREFLESVDHYRSAADRAADGVAAALDLRSAADATLAISDAETGVRLLLDAAERSVADGNVRARMLALAVIAMNRYPTGSLYDVPAERSELLLRQALGSARPGDPQVDALLATAQAWDHGGRRVGADPELAQRAVDAARRTGDPVLIAGALDAQTVAAGNSGRLRDARSYAVERMRLIGPLPRHDPYAAAEIIDAFHVAPTTAAAVGDLPAALAAVGSADDPVGDHPYISLPRLIRVCALTGQFDACVEHADALWERWRNAGAPPVEWMASAMSLAGMVHGLRDDGLFEVWQARALEVSRCVELEDAPWLPAPYTFARARVAVHLGAVQQAPDVARRAFAGFGERWWEPYARAAAAELAVVAGLPDAPDLLAAIAPDAAQNDWAAACLLRATARSSGDLDALAQAAEAFDHIGAHFERAATLALHPTQATQAHADLAALQVAAPSRRVVEDGA